MIKKAFTLAEVLMVIGIIGVIAAITIPNLNQDVDAEKNIALLRGIVEDINVAIGKVGMNEHSLFTACGLDLSSAATNCMGEKIQQQMKVSKNCAGNSGCFNGSVSGQFYCGYEFIIANGASVCTVPPPYKQSHRWLMVDVDGPKKGTNTYGEDQFLFEMSDDGLNFTSNGGRSSRRMFSVGNDETEWAMIVGNQDYLKCPGVLQWGVKEGCQ